MNQMKELEYEKQKLGEILDGLEETLDGERLRLKALPNQYGHNPRLLQSLMSMTSQKIAGIENHIDKPYFARIDFKNLNGKQEKLYIGKVGVMDLDSEILVTDWRAPIATLYYDSNLGKTSYESPDGTIEGSLELKRQIIIDKRELAEIFDVDSVSDDELLKPYLGANADNRLKNIVASIQKEQNDIIRMALAKNLIIQGVAGSGKTTVALHRIAYLLYNYSKKYQSNQFMVIGPNKFFINYISNVLPDLDAGQVEQYTYEELAKTYINEDISVKDPTEKLVSVLSTGENSEVSKYKLSMNYKEEVDKFLAEFENEYIADEGISVNGFCVFTKQEVIRLLGSLSDTLELDFSARLQRVQKILENRVLDTRDYLISKAKKHFDMLIEKATEKEQEELMAQKRDTVERLGNGLKEILKRKCTLSTKKVLPLYKKFVSNHSKYALDDRISKVLVKEAAKGISKKQLEFEDLPALMYIKLKLMGSGEFKDFAHVVVDEAQDFGTFNFFVLKKLMAESTFSIFGDLTQGIYEYRAINSWEEVVESSFEEKCEIMKLEKSYRTTIEIMLAANLVSKSIGLFEGKPVIRHGKEVNVKKVSKTEKTKYILDSINNYTSLGHSSIAIICKTPEESQKVYEELSIHNDNISLISGDKETYDGGVCVVPSHLSKGLEFDCVIIYDADEKTYSANNKVDMKLLYVAMTRALHTLDICYTGKVTKSLETLA